MLDLEIAPSLVTAPAAALFTLTEVKAQCRVDHTDDDTLLTRLIDVGTSYLDGYRGILRRCLINQTWKINLDGFCDDDIDLPLGNLVSITSVKYYDANNTQQTLSSSYYSAFQGPRGPYVSLNETYSWPVTYDRKDAVEITWVAGFGAAAANVPEAIRHAGLMYIAHLYDNRSTVSAGETVVEMPMAFHALVAPFRMNPL